MPTYNFPSFSTGPIQINSTITFEKRDRYITYFNFMTPIYRHAEKDFKSFRMFTSQLCSTGACSASEIINTFGVSKQTVFRDIKLYEKEGTAGFFKTLKRGGPNVILPEIKLKAEQLFNEGWDVQDVAKELNVPYGTLRKAIYRGKVIFIKSNPRSTQREKKRPN